MGCFPNVDPRICKFTGLVLFCFVLNIFCLFCFCWFFSGVLLQIGSSCGNIGPVFRINLKVTKPLGGRMSKTIFNLFHLFGGLLYTDSTVLGEYSGWTIPILPRSRVFCVEGFAPPKAKVPKENLELSGGLLPDLPPGFGPAFIVERPIRILHIHTHLHSYATLHNHLCTYGEYCGCEHSVQASF